MEKSISKDDLLLGGPGLDGYAYRAALYCIDCGKAIIRGLPKDTFTWSEACDTEQVPCPVFFGDSECRQYCDTCGVYLYGGENVIPSSGLLDAGVDC